MQATLFGTNHKQENLWTNSDGFSCSSGTLGEAFFFACVEETLCSTQYNRRTTWGRRSAWDALGKIQRFNVIVFPYACAALMMASSICCPRWKRCVEHALITFITAGNQSWLILYQIDFPTSLTTNQDGGSRWYRQVPEHLSFLHVTEPESVVAAEKKVKQQETSGIFGSNKNVRSVECPNRERNKRQVHCCFANVLVVTNKPLTKRTGTIYDKGRTWISVSVTFIPRSKYTWGGLASHRSHYHLHNYCNNCSFPRILREQMFWY